MLARARREALLSTGIQVGLLVALLALWQTAAAQKWVSALILPTLTATVGRFVELLGDPSAHATIGVTAAEFGIAMFIALAGGLAIGALCGMVRYLGDLIEPLLLALYAIPIIMAFPLCILFFGIGWNSKIAFGALYAFFPIALQTMKGLRHVDPALLRAAYSMGAGRRQTLLKVMVPAAFPAIMTGVRIGAVLGLLSVVAGEMLASLEGVGHSLATAVSTFESSSAFAWILLVILLVAVLNVGLSWLERRVEGEQ